MQTAKDNPHKRTHLIVKPTALREHLVTEYICHTLPRIINHEGKKGELGQPKAVQDNNI